MDRAENRLSILVFDPHGELHAHARSAFVGDRVVRVHTNAAASRALECVEFDIIMCRPDARDNLPVCDDRVTVVDRPLDPETIVGLIARALERRARAARRLRAGGDFPP